jgi:hypothetical protein
MNFFEQIYYAVAKPNQYYQLTKGSNGRATAFVFLFVLILTFINVAVPVIDVFTGSDSIFKIFEEELPYFEMNDGELYVEEPYEVSSYNTYILVDTSIERFGEKDVNRNYSQVTLISRTNMIEYQNGRIQIVEFSSLQGFNFNNQIINSFKPFIYLIMVLVILLVYVFFVGFYYLTVLIYSLIGLLVSSSNNLNLPYGRIFKTAIYGKVTVQLLFAITGMLHLSIPFGAKNTVSICVTCIYVIFGILSHKSDETCKPNNNRMNDYYNHNNNGGNYNNYGNNNYGNNNDSNNNSNYGSNNSNNGNYNNSNYGSNNSNNGNYNNSNYGSNNSNNGNYNNSNYGSNNSNNGNYNNSNYNNNNYNYNASNSSYSNTNGNNNSQSLYEVSSPRYNNTDGGNTGTESKPDGNDEGNINSPS